MMMELHVISRKTGQLLRQFALGDEVDVLIGRDEDCDIRLNAPSVSRTHCLIETVNGDMRLRDLGSTGGTRSGGRDVDEIRVEHGLEVEVGPAILRFIED